MKSFITTLAMTALARAYWVECELGSDGCDDNGEMWIEDPADPASRQIGWALEDFFREVDRFMNDGVDAEAGMTEAWDEFLCWWADREPETTCPKRERWAALDALAQECWMQEGMTFDWDTEQCMTYEEECALPNEWCVKTWTSDEWGNSWCDWQCDRNLVLTRVTPKRMLTRVTPKRMWPAAVTECGAQAGMAWDFVSSTCMTKEEECAVPSTNGCWKTWIGSTCSEHCEYAATPENHHKAMARNPVTMGLDWQAYMECYDTPGMMYHMGTETCMTAEDECAMPDEEFGCKKTWSLEWDQCYWDCSRAATPENHHMAVARHSETPISADCQFADDPRWCQDIVDYFAAMFDSSSSHKRAKIQYALKTVGIDFSLEDAATWMELNAAQQADLVETLTPVAEEVGYYADWWGQQLEQLGREQEVRQQEIDAAFKEMLADSVIIDGMSLRDMFGDPETWGHQEEPNWEETPNRLRLPARVQRALFKKQEVPAYLHKTLFSLADLEIPETATGVQVSLEFPDDIDMQVMGWIGRGQEIIESFDQWAGEMLKEMEDEMEDAAEGIVDETVNPIGDALKTAVENGTISFDHDWTMEIGLAEKKTAKKSKKQSGDNSKAYAGAAFGAIGLISVFALMGTCNNKQVRANEEALL